jgi:serine/threonine protein kinase
VEDYLAGAAATLRAPLLGELLRVELEARRTAGEAPNPDEFLTRFPADAAAVAAAFQAPTIAPRTPGTAPRPGAAPPAVHDQATLAPGRDATVDLAQSLEANVQIGDFRIEKRLGAGGMGIVYLARQLSLNRLVALKVLGTALTDRTDIARFQREAQAIARLNHPGIAGVYFVGQDGEICYLAMEYIDGMSLREVIKQLSSLERHFQSIDDVLQATSLGGEAPEVRFDGPTLTYTAEPAVNEKPVEPGGLAAEVKRLISSAEHIRRSREIVRDTAIALAHAHERGVIHRDIKPENILLDRHGKPHLIDFGLARFFEDVTLTNTGALVGTPMYMSPEQVTGRIELDHRTDIYSLGLVLYEMLTLRKPFVSPTREGILRQIVTKAIVPLTWKNRAVSRDLESVVHGAMAKDPDERYQTATALADDLQQSLRGEPVSATPYQYRFDDTTLIAERPRGVTFVSFEVFLVACVFISSLFGNLRELIILFRHGNYISSHLYSVPFYASLICCRYWLGRGLMKGLNIARLSIIIGFGILTLFISKKIVVGLYSFNVEIYITQFIYWHLFILFFSLLPIYVLLHRRTRDWFRLAARLRSEHKQQKVSAD